MELRDARPDDAGAIEEIRIAGWRSAYADLLPADLIAGLRVTPERLDLWRERMQAPGAVTLLAEHDGAVQAFAHLLPARDDDLDPARSTELAALYVSPSTWGTGVGGRLLDEGFARVPRPVHVLWTLEGNVRAQRFYADRGFAADGARKERDLGAPATEVRFRRAV